MAKEIITAGTQLKMGEVVLEGLLSTPELGEGEAEKLEVTDLSDTNKRYINGLKDLGDSLDFSFNYVSQADSSFYKLRAVEESGATAKFEVILPDGLSFGFDAYVQCKLDALEVGSQVKFTASLTIASAIEVTAPTFS